MKLLLLISVVCFAVALAAPADKQKRDILPGDPRYGTDHHHHHENEVQISKALGNYVGSFSSRADTEGHLSQASGLSSYGPPNYNPGQPLGSDYHASSDATKSSVALQVPSTSYGIPDTTHLLNNKYLEPAIEDRKSELKAHNLNAEQQLPSPAAPINSYASFKPQHEEHVQVPHTSYGIPVAEASIEQQSSIAGLNLQRTAIPEVRLQQLPLSAHRHVETPVPQAKATTSHLPVQTQGVLQQSSLSKVPSFASLSYVGYPNYPSYSLYSGIPVRTLDHQVRLQIPQSYAVPVTKHVSYPVAVSQTVEVPKPYYVRVAHPVQVAINRPYAVEVPRAVPYSVPQYVRTTVPVIQQHINLDTAKANPVQDFFQNPQSAFQNVLENLPNLQNPFQAFQNPFANYEVPSFPSLPSFAFPSLPSSPSLPSLPSLPSPPSPPSLPSLPSFPQTQTAPAVNNNVDRSPSFDSVIIENPTLRTKAIGTKSAIPQSTVTANRNRISHTQSIIKDATPCVGCANSTNKKEYVQPVDANGGYVY